MGRILVGMRRVKMAALAATPAWLVVRRAWWAYLPLLAMLALGCVFWVALAWHAEHPVVRTALMVLCAAMLALTLLVAQRVVRLRDEANWLLRLTEESLILNPADAPIASDGDVVEVPFTEIVSARRVVEKRLGVGDHTIEDVHETHVYLELGLADVDSSALTGFTPPLTVPDARTLRIGWRDRTTRLTPSLATFMRGLPVTIAREPDTRVDWRESPTLSDDEFRERVRALCAGNDKLGAVKVVRVRYNMSLRAARAFVEHIAGP